MKTPILAAIILIFAGQHVSFAQSPQSQVQTPSSTQKQDMSTSFDTLINSFVADEQFAGVVLVADETGPLFTQAYGFADRELGVPMQTEHAFIIGSMTKAFTAALVLQLVDEGLIDLSAPVTKYWPEFPDPSSNAITIDHLLTHRSGLEHWGGVSDFLNQQARMSWKPEDIVTLYTAQGLRFEPGAENAYSSIGYMTLGIVLEKVTGTAYGALLKARIFDPLHMYSTQLDDQVHIIQGRVKAYRYNFLEARYDNAEYRDASTTWATGGILTTAQDLFLWAEALHGSAPKIISPAMRERMFDESKGRQAYGWDVQVSDAGKTVMHGGLVTGYRSQITLDLDNHQTYIALGNLRDGNVSNVIAALPPVLDGEPGTLARRSLMKEMLRISATQGSDAAIARFDAIMQEEDSQFDTGQTQLIRAALELRSDEACDRAAPLYISWIKAFPQSPYLSTGLSGGADCLLKIGEKQAARELIIRLKSVNPEDRMLQDLEARASQ